MLSSDRPTDNPSPSILSNRSQPKTPQRVRKAASSGSQSSTSMDPPRPAREGHEWVWFPDGYWAEREIRDPTDKFPAPSSSLRWRKTSARGKSSMDEARNLSPKTTKDSGELRQLAAHGTEKPETKIPASPYLSEMAHVESLQNPGGRQSSVGRSTELRIPDGETSPLPLQMRGSREFEDIPVVVLPPLSESTRRPNVLSAARRGFDSARFRTNEKTQTTPDTPTAPGLDEPATGYFAQVPVQRPRMMSPEESVESSFVRKEPTTSRWRLFGKSSWYRKGLRPRTKGSASSSLKEVLGGPGRSVAGSGIETAYPGGEAVRVSTPPMKEDTADSKPRGLFFDLAANPPIPSTSSDTSSTQESIIKRTRSSKKDKRSSSGHRSSRIEEEDLLQPQHQKEQQHQRQHSGERRNFELEALHSAESNTCPAHPQSQARPSVCVYHGRRKGSRQSDASRISQIEPEEEDGQFWSSARGRAPTPGGRCRRGERADEHDLP